MLNFAIYKFKSRLKSDVDPTRQFKLLEICLIYDDRMYDNEIHLIDFLIGSRRNFVIIIFTIFRPDQKFT